MTTNLDCIRDAGLFADLSASQLESVAKVAREFGFKKNEYLFRIGSETDTLFVVVSGGVQITLPLVVLGADTEIVLEELSPGNTIGWSALVPPHVLTMSAKAVTDARLIGFGRQQLHELFESAPEIGYRVLANLAAVIGRRLHVTQAMWARELQRFVSEKYR